MTGQMLGIKDLQTNKTTELQSGSLIAIQGGIWEDYWNLSNEDLKVEFIGDVIYIHSPATLAHESISGYLLTAVSNHIEGKGLILDSASLFA